MKSIFKASNTDDNCNILRNYYQIEVNKPNVNLRKSQKDLPLSGYIFNLC